MFMKPGVSTHGTNSPEPTRRGVTVEAVASRGTAPGFKRRAATP
jgi:hypothetical protein